MTGRRELMVMVILRRRERMQSRSWLLGDDAWLGVVHDVGCIVGHHQSVESLLGITDLS